MKAIAQFAVLVLLATLSLTVLGVAIFIGTGALLSQWLPLSLFQASALAVGATLAIALVVQIVTTMMQLQVQHDRDNNDYFDWEPEEQADGTPVFSRPNIPKIGRNAPCPCGSRKKHKNCCGKSSAT